MLLAIKRLAWGIATPHDGKGTGVVKEDCGFPRLTVLQATTDLTRKASHDVDPSPSASEESRKPRTSDNSS